MTKTARKRKARKLRELAAKAAPDDERFIRLRTQCGAGCVSKASAKRGKSFCKAQREEATWKPGFRGVVSTMGSHELGPDYAPRLRVKDGTRYVSQRAWLRKGVT